MGSIKSKYFAIAIGTIISVLVCLSFAQNTEGPKPPLKVGYPLMESPHSNPIAINGNFVYVTNTPSSTVDVIDRESEKVVDRIHVGIDPVSIAVRPDGKEIWVSNHVSDSVSVIDSDPKSPTFHVVIATIQEFDSNKATKFDEPVGIAFASNEKAYVALSSENQIAVIDVKSRNITKRLNIPAQDPRALFVKNGLLFVIPFESGNKTQLSGGYQKSNNDNSQITFDAEEHFVKNNNVLSKGYKEDIIKHNKQPDYDLFIFDTKTDFLIDTVSSIGTLLYGITVDSNLNIFITQTDARNDINGKAGTKQHTLKELENRPYLNQIGKIKYKLENKKNSELQIINLEPIPPNQPDRKLTFATPYAVKMTADEKFIVSTASGSNCVFILDFNNNIISRTSTGAGPVGIAVDKVNQIDIVWTYNAYDNSVSKINISDNRNIKKESEILLNDQTEADTKLGRKFFNDANFSSTGTFSCASCHPNGQIDQLIWVLDAPIVTGGKQIQPRATMPIRGLRDTEPFHWDGTQGDPYGGINATSLQKHTKPNCVLSVAIDCIRSLIKNNLNSTMKLESSNNSDSRDITDSQIDKLANYNLSVPYPPAPKRAYDNSLTAKAIKGFELFHIKGDKNPKQNPNVCGDCHRMPFWVSSKTPGFNGMDAPTWRGAYDRHQITPQGRLNIIDFPWIYQIAINGRDEFKMWQLSWSGDNGPRHDFDPVWNMVLEGSTGFSGSYARQVTVNKNNYSSKLTLDLLKALEISAQNHSIVLEAEGIFINNNEARKFEIQFDANFKGGSFIEKNTERKYYSRIDLLKLAEQGNFIGTFTARHGFKTDQFLYPQPALWTLGPIYEQRGRQQFPILTTTEKTMLISGRNFGKDAHIFVDGVLIDGTFNLNYGEKVTVSLANLPPVGMHMLQVQEPEGRMSNDFIFFVK